MSLQSQTLRDLIGSVINTGSTSTLNVIQSTTTDLIRAVITESPVYTPYTLTAYTYNVSGYTISSGTSGAVLTNFYVDSPVGPFTGTTLKTVTTSAYIVQSYISGSTLVPTGTTVTEIATEYSGTGTTYTNYLNVNIVGFSGSGATINTKQISTAYTGLTTDFFIAASGGTYTITLPAATGSGRVLIIKNLTSDTKTIAGNGAELIDGSNTTTLTTIYSSVKIIDTVSGIWYII